MHPKKKLLGCFLHSNHFKTFIMYISRTQAQKHTFTHTNTSLLWWSSDYVYIFWHARSGRTLWKESNPNLALLGWINTTLFYLSLLLVPRHIIQIDLKNWVSVIQNLRRNRLEYIQGSIDRTIEYDEQNKNSNRIVNFIRMKSSFTIIMCIVYTLHINRTVNVIEHKTHVYSVRLFILSVWIKYLVIIRLFSHGQF